MPNKYNATKVKIDGITFDSKKEARRYNDLKLLEAAGEIFNLVCHPKYEFEVNGFPVVYPTGRKVTYKADFKYRDRKDGPIVEDVKGMQTIAFKLKWALMNSCHGIKVKIT